jgi:pyridoxine kinase
MPSPAGAVLLISSHVARGYVGNRAMLFALERLGYTGWAVPTVILPHHPGHGPAKKIVPTDDGFTMLLDRLVEGAEAGNVRAILSGYFATEAQVRAVARAVRIMKSARPELIYLCDPVIGDRTGLYVEKSLAEAMRDELLPLADLATPNVFECAWLAGRADDPSVDLALLARALPTPTVFVTSAPALMRGQIGNLFVTASETILFEHPELSTPAKGTGDLFAALTLARHLEGHAWPKAAELALSSVFEIVAGTTRTGADELLLPELQQSLLAPRAAISVRRVLAG